MDHQFAKVLEHLGAYAEALRLVESTHALCADTVRAWLKTKPDAEAAYAWLASQPLALIGVLIPVEVLQVLAPARDTTPGHDDEIPF